MYNPVVIWSNRCKNLGGSKPPNSTEISEQLPKKLAVYQKSFSEIKKNPLKIRKVC